MKRAMVLGLLGLTAMFFMASCSDSTAPDDGAAANVFRFKYASSLAGSGDFHARGEMELFADSLPDSSFVVAATDSSGALVILGLQGNIKARFNVIYLVIADGSRPTTIQVDSTCLLQATCRAAPPIAAFALDEDAEDAYGCAAIDATITLTSVTEDRVRGTVSGRNGKCVGVVSEKEGDFRLTNGTFDAMLVHVDEADDMPDVVMKSLPLAERRVVQRHFGSLLRKQE
jgi:hypothetical protein